MNFWINLSPGVRGFIRGAILAVIFAALTYVMQNIGTLGLSPYLSGLITAIIAALENQSTNTAKAKAPITYSL